MFYPTSCSDWLAVTGWFAFYLAFKLGDTNGIATWGTSPSGEAQPIARDTTTIKSRVLISHA